MDKFTPLLAKEFSRREEHIENILRLLDEGNTVPFIARYRKEMHGTTDDQTIRAIADRLAYLRGLDERKAAVVSAIEAQGKLTDELSAAIENAQTLAEVEDIYRPYKQKRRTRATIAREKGLAPLAELLLSQTVTSGTLEALAAPYVNEEKGVMSTDDALAGAGDIIAETISDDAAIRAALRRLYRTRGVLWAKAATDEDSVYRLYYDYREPVSRVQGHRVLAVNRGEREGMLKAGVEIEDALALQEIRRAVFRGISISNAFVNACCEDAWRRLIEPSAEREIRGELTDAADEAAIRAFGQNLQPLLMQPPLRNRVTMGFDPAYRTGCKIAVVDETGMAVQQLTEESDKMLVAPLRFKSVLLDEMDHVIAAARMGRPASMILKNNSISDRDIILKLQEASCAGVRIDMIVRGICCVRAEVPGKTENLHIRSLVGRYLEHGRIYSFFDGTHTRIYIASGDFLTRNTECRVEVGVRVEDPALVQKLTDILQLQLRDNVNARVMDASGNYQKVKPAEGEPLVNSQMGMYELLRNDWQRPEPWKCTTPAPEAEKPAAVCQEVTAEQLKQELPHVFQPAPEKAEKAATAQQPDHYEALEQMLNNKPRAAQPASKAPAAPRPVVKPVVTAPKKKSLLERIGSFFRR